MKQIRLLVVQLMIVSTCVYQPISFNVHFDNGSEYEGRVEIQYDTGMCRVLEYGIITNGTQPAYMCGPLSFESAIANDSRDESDYGGINGTAWIGSVGCNDAEYALEQRADRDGGQWESIKCVSNSARGDLTANNKTQQFCCNIDVELSSEDSRKIRDGNNINITFPAAANIKSIRIVLSDLHANVTINNYITIKMGSSVWVIVTALAGVVVAVVGLIAYLSNALCIIIPDDLKKKIGCGRCVQGSKSETSYTRLTNMPECAVVDDADMRHSVDGEPQGEGDPRPSDDTSADATMLT